MKLDRKINPELKKAEVWIVNALLTLMEEFPYDDITIKMIAEEADVVRKTVYRNFNTKEDMLRLYIKIISRELYVFIGSDAVNSTENIVLSFIEFWKKHSDFLSLIHSNQLSSLLERELDTLVAILRKNPVLEKYYKLDSLTDIQLHYLTLFYISGFTRVLNEWLDRDMEESEESICIFLQQIFIQNLELITKSISEEK